MIAAADVDAEGDAGVAVDDRVVELDAGVEHLVGIAAALAVALANRLVEQRRVLRRVDLDVLAAQALQLGDLAPGEIHEVGEICVACRIRRARLVGIVVGRRLLRADQRDLDRLLRPARADT